MNNQHQDSFEDRYVEVSEADLADQATPAVPDQENVDLHDLARRSGAPVIAEADPADVYEQSVPAAQDDGYEQG